MNPKHLHLRTDPKTGDIWITEERRNDPAIRRIKNVTNDVLLALCADVISVDGTSSVSREVKFSDGIVVRVIVERLDCA